jgi:hypothetical protein
MIVASIIILGALFWLLMETNWLTIRLPTYAAEPVIELSNLRNTLGLLNTHGILALAGIIGPFILVTLDLVAAFSQPKYSLVRQSINSLALTSMGWDIVHSVIVELEGMFSQLAIPHAPHLIFHQWFFLSNLTTSMRIEIAALIHSIRSDQKPLISPIFSSS